VTGVQTCALPICASARVVFKILTILRISNKTQIPIIPAFQPGKLHHCLSWQPHIIWYRL